MNRRERPLLVVITGPTASGKTSLAIDVARRLGCEIISADSRQIFRDLPVGTAAPTATELTAVLHHLVGTLKLDDYYSASCFESDALALLPGIFDRSGGYAVVCGGSMMYVDALVNGIDEMPTVSQSVREYVLNMLDAHGIEAVLAQLLIVDPDYWERVDRSNTRRVVHALEVSLEAGRPYSSLLTGASRKRPFTIVKVGIERTREDLFARINARVDAMIGAGLENEARRAFAQGNFNSLNTVGYKEMASYFAGEMDWATAVARIAKNTRVYAKKQLTWLKRDSSINWLHPDTALPDAIELIEMNIAAGRR